MSIRGALVAVALVSAGCATLGPKEVATLGRKSYGTRSRAEVLQACKVALETLGYKLTLVDFAGGRLKTAPKTVAVVASGGRYSAVAQENAVAWSLELKQGSGSLTLQATPRAFGGGVENPKPRWPEDYARTMFQQLFAEIESNLGRAR
jgi:hypothetical protein